MQASVYKGTHLHKLNRVFAPSIQALPSILGRCTPSIRAFGVRPQFSCCPGWARFIHYGQQVTLLGLLDMHERRFRHRRPRHPPASIGDVVRCTGASTSVAHLFSDKKDPGCVLRWPDDPTMPTIVWCAARFGPRTSPFCSLYGRCHRNRHGTWNSNPRICRRHPDLRTSVAPPRIVNPLPYTSVGLRIGNRILDELKSAETQCLSSKTEFIWIGTRRQLSKVEEEALMVDGQSITPMVKVRDLGVFIDRELTTEAHVSNNVRGCMYQLRQLRSVKRSLTLDSRRALATAFVAIVVSTTATVSYKVSRKEKFSDFKWF